MAEVDWEPVVTRNPRGFLEIREDEYLIRGPIQKVCLDYCSCVVITTRWRARARLGRLGLPITRWEMTGNDPVEIPNFIVPYEIEEKGEPCVRFGSTILYFNPEVGTLYTPPSPNGLLAVA